MRVRRFQMTRQAGGRWLAATLCLAGPLAQAVSLSPIPDAVTSEDTPTLPLPIRVHLSDELRRPSFWIKSSNPSLAPDSSAAFKGADHERTLVLTPAANEAGRASITVFATDGITTVTQSFALTVNAVNDPPTLSKIADQAVLENVCTPAISFTIGDVETPAASLIVTATSSDCDVLPSSAIVLAGSGAVRTLVAKPAEDKSGLARVTLTVSDGEASTTQTFNIRVGAVNQPPVVNAGPDQTLHGTNTMLLSGTATDDDARERLVTSWSLVSGPSPVEFANQNASNTAVKFSTDGIYTLRLTASDGELTGTDDVNVVVANRGMARTEGGGENSR